ncbi:MAG TPA: MFS transporter [Candidatus Sulfotelmatobacter sp.]|nr:MFS transporter [Candidatus Sulfotelmatobacter sp.]
MSPLAGAFNDFLEAARLFSIPSRRFLLGEFLAWVGMGIFQVLFNLYLVQGHFQEAFVGRAVSLNALGVALLALPAGWLADRYGRRRVIVGGALVDGMAQLTRAMTLHPGAILAGSFISGAGQAMLAIAAAPFIAEHSTARERTHLFSAFFAAVLFAGVIGNILGGWIPPALMHLPQAWRPNLLGAYRISLLIGAGFVLAGTLPLALLRGHLEKPTPHLGRRLSRADLRLLAPIALNSILIGLGAGLVIPFMNLYFARRFACSSAQIGSFFSLAQVVTAAASLIGPAIARRFGKLRTAVSSELLSLPFLVTLGAEHNLGIAVTAFLFRATLMQASTPLVNAFVMDMLPPELRARSTSLNNLLWNLGWAMSATLAGAIIQRFGYDVPFYCTAALYAIAASSFFLAFRGHREPPVVSAGEILASSESGEVV